MGQSTQLIIRTSDRGAFKRCRRSWDWGSKIRSNLTFKGPAPKPLDFGTSVHRGLEVWYDPTMWSWGRDVVALLSLQAFRESQEEQLRGYLKEVLEESLQGDLKADYAERTVLGEGMLRGYFAWSKTRDVGYTPVYVEVEFEVPIHGLEGTYAAGAVYQGRIDLVMQDDQGRYWIWDHKTAARFDSTEHLELDEQCGSYAWALSEKLGINIAGVVYNELKKAFPERPAELKRGGYSKNKQAGTTYELYVETLMEVYGYIPNEYNEHLEYLKDAPNDFFRRTRVHRTVEELQQLGEDITLEALDMLDPNIRIYKNATKFNCKNCMFRTPCIAKQDGSDVDYILNENYKVRTSDAEHADGAGPIPGYPAQADGTESGRSTSSESGGNSSELQPSYLR